MRKLSVAFARDATILGTLMAIAGSQPPHLSPRPERGPGWYVEAKWPTGATEKIGQFATYSEARNWIALESTSYFVLRELGSWSGSAARGEADPAVRLPLKAGGTASEASREVPSAPQTDVTS
jgi:hypothetical protein